MFCLKKRCSGALYKIMLWKILKKKDVSPWRALCIASAIFGAVHILNLLGRPYCVLGTVTQVIYTFCVGIIIGTVYWSSKNIWSCFLLHYIFNALGGYSDLLVEKNNRSRDCKLHRYRYRLFKCCHSVTHHATLHTYSMAHIQASYQKALR